MPSNKASVKIDKELNRQLSIIALLEKQKKEDFMDNLLKEALKKYQDKYNTYKFK